jgi:hypothetical protein
MIVPTLALSIAALLPAPAAAPSEIILTLSPGSDLSVQADNIDFEAAARTYELSGSVRLQLPDGVEIRLRRGRLQLPDRDARDQPRRYVLTPLPVAGTPPVARP